MAAGALLWPAAVGTASAQQSSIVVEADKLEYEHEGNVIRATGNVDVRWEGRRLTAGEVVVEQEDRDVAATGGVELDAPEVFATAASLELDVDRETGLLRDVEARVKDGGGYFGGSIAEKLEGPHYRVEDGYYTTCDVDAGHAPDWELSGRELELNLDDYGTIRDGSFKVRGVPVFYLPWMVFPAKQTRQSGLLMPRLGTSDRRGFIYSQPFFWDISKHQDLTLTLNVETAARVGLAGEYRYKPSRERRGALEASYFNEKIRGNQESEIDSPLFAGANIPQDRGLVAWRHREKLRGSGEHEGFEAYVDALVVSDDLFLREIDSVASDSIDRENRRTRRYTDSRVGVAGYDEFVGYGAEMVVYQDFVNPDRNTVQRPAGLWTSADGDLLGGAWRLDAAGDAFLRDEGVDGQRLDTRLQVDMPTLALGQVRLRSWASGRATGYNLDDRTVLAENGTLDFVYDRNPLRGVLDAGAEARTKFGRNFAWDQGQGGPRTLRHTIEPFVGIRYTEVDSDGEVPLLNGVDSIDGRDTASYGVDSRFFLTREDGKGSDEVARLSLAHSYNFTREVLGDHFSDIDLAGFLRPMEGLALRSVASFNVGEWLLTGAQASVAWESGPSRFLPGPRSRVALAYRFVRGTVLESLEGLALLGVHRRLSLALQGRYDLEGRKLVESGGGVRIRSACDCWTVDLGVVERVNPDELQFRMVVELAGLTSLGGGAGDDPSPALRDVSYGDEGFWRPGW